MSLSGKAYDLLNDIRRHPDDPALRLVFADWLEEFGNETQQQLGQLMHVQMRLAELQPDAPERPWLIASKRELEATLRGAIQEQLSGLGIKGCVTGFERGLPKVEMSVTDFLSHGQALFEQLPVVSARLAIRNPTQDIEQLADSPLLAHLSELDLSGNAIGDGGVQALAASPHLARLTGLNLIDNAIGPAGAADLAASPQLARLTELDLGFNAISPAGAESLAASPHMARLTHLDLRGNLIGPAGAAHLAASPHLARLNCLNLGDNAIDDEGVQALAAGDSQLRHLAHLDLGGNRIGTGGAQALAASPHLENLTSLDLRFNGIGPEGAQALVRSPRLNRLLDLSLDNAAPFAAFLSEERQKAPDEKLFPLRNLEFINGDHVSEYPALQRWAERSGDGPRSGWASGVT